MWLIALARTAGDQMFIDDGASINADIFTNFVLMLPTKLEG